MKTREEALKKFYDEMDKYALGFANEDIKREQARRIREEKAIGKLAENLKPCPFCGGKAMFYNEHNPEYPDGIYIKCNNCGIRTEGYVEFLKDGYKYLLEVPKIRQCQHYSKMKSVKEAIKAWQQRR